MANSRTSCCRSKFSLIRNPDKDILAIRVVEKLENSVTMSIKLKTGQWVTDTVTLGRKIFQKSSLSSHDLSVVENDPKINFASVNCASEIVCENCACENSDVLKVEAVLKTELEKRERNDESDHEIKMVKKGHKLYCPCKTKFNKLQRKDRCQTGLKELRKGEYSEFWLTHAFCNSCTSLYRVPPERV